MPKILEVNGYKFYFWSEEGNELPHIHVRKGDGKAKIWLEPEIKWEYYKDFTVREQRDIRRLINKNYEYLINQWHEFFG